MDEKDDSKDGDDRTEWDLAWARMPLRRLLAPPKIDVASFGEVVTVTISEVPPQFSDKLWRESETCPICVATTAGAQRLPASLYPKFASGFNYGLGVWVHPSCFASCPLAEEPTPIPW